MNRNQVPVAPRAEPRAHRTTGINLPAGTLVLLRRVTFERSRRYGGRSSVSALLSNSSSATRKNWTTNWLRHFDQRTMTWQVRIIFSTDCEVRDGLPRLFDCRRMRYWGVDCGVGGRWFIHVASHLFKSFEYPANRRCQFVDSAENGSRTRTIRRLRTSRTSKSDAVCA